MPHPLLQQLLLASSSSSLSLPLRGAQRPLIDAMVPTAFGLGQGQLAREKPRVCAFCLAPSQTFDSIEHLNSKGQQVTSEAYREA